MFELFEVTARKVVGDDDIGTTTEKFFNEKRADEACAPSNEGCPALQSTHILGYPLGVNNLVIPFEFVDVYR